MKHFLTNEQRTVLSETHRSVKEKRFAYKINAILLLDKGWNFYQVAEALLIDVSTIYRYLNIYQNEGLDCLLSDNYKGGTGKLSKEQESQLKEHLESRVYPDAKSIVKYIEETYGITYTAEGLVHLLHRLGFVYKKSKHVPGCANPDKQKEFIEETYQRIKEEKGPSDKIYIILCPVMAGYPKERSKNSQATLDEKRST